MATTILTTRYLNGQSVRLR